MIEKRTEKRISGGKGQMKVFSIFSIFFKKKPKTRTEEQREWMFPEPPLWIRITEFLIRFIPYVYRKIKFFLIWVVAITLLLCYVFGMIWLLLVALDFFIDSNVWLLIDSELARLIIKYGLSTESIIYKFVIKPFVYTLYCSMEFLRCFGIAVHVTIVPYMISLIRWTIVYISVGYDMYVYILSVEAPMLWKQLAYDENVWLWLFWWLTDPYISWLIQHIKEIPMFAKQRYIFLTITTPASMLLYKHYTLRDYATNFDYMYRWYITIRNVTRDSWRIYKWPVGLYIVFHIIWFLFGATATLYVLTFRVFRMWWRGATVPSGEHPTIWGLNELIPEWFRKYLIYNDYILSAPYEWLQSLVKNHYNIWMDTHPYWSTMAKDTRYFVYSYVGVALLTSFLIHKMFRFRDWVCLETQRAEVVSRKKLFIKVWFAALGCLTLIWYYFPMSEFVTWYLMTVCVVVLYTLSAVIYSLHLGRENVFFPDFALYCAWDMFLDSIGWCINVVLDIYSLIRECVVGTLVFLFDPLLNWYFNRFVPGFYKLLYGSVVMCILCAYLYVVYYIIVKIVTFPILFHRFVVFVMIIPLYLWDFLNPIYYWIKREFYLTFVKDPEKEFERRRSGKATTVDWYSKDIEDEHAYKELQERIENYLLPEKKVFIPKRRLKKNVKKVTDENIKLY